MKVAADIMDLRRIVDSYFSELLGADIGRAEPGEILIARSTLCEEPESADSVTDRTVPVWILISAGRGIASSSRFLHRIVDAWAGNFAAPEHMLRKDFLEDLRAELSRVLDSPAIIEQSRVFMDRAANPHVAEARLADCAPRSVERILALRDGAQNGGWVQLIECRHADHAFARLVLSAGFMEYGRMVRLCVWR